MIDLNTLPIHIQKMGLQVSWVQVANVPGVEHQMIGVLVVGLRYPVLVKILNSPEATIEDLLKMLKDYIISISGDKG